MPKVLAMCPRCKALLDVWTMRLSRERAARKFFGFREPLVRDTDRVSFVQIRHAVHLASWATAWASCWKGDTVDLGQKHAEAAAVEPNEATQRVRE